MCVCVCVCVCVGWCFCSMMAMGETVCVVCVEEMECYLYNDGNERDSVCVCVWGGGVFVQG